MRLQRRFLVPLAVCSAWVFVGAGSASAYVYWSDVGNAKIGRANLDGTGVNSSLVSTNVSFPLQITTNGNYIWWANQNGYISRAGVDGSGSQQVVTGVSTARGVTVNGSNLFWVGASSGIVRGDLDGTNSSVAVSNANGGTPFYLSTTSSRIIWARVFNSALGRADFDGGNLNNAFASVTSPQAVAVWGDYIYWTQGSTAIGRMNLDGSGVNNSFLTVNGNVRGITADAEHIYWGNWPNGNIGRANIDGTGKTENWVTVANSDTRGVAVDPPVFDVGPTSKNYGTVSPGNSSQQVFTVTNTGRGPLSQPTASLSGTDAARFQIDSNTCTSNVAPAATCAVTVSFHPTNSSSVSANVDFDYRSGNNGQPTETLVPLSGNPSPTFSVSPTSKAYGSVSVGSNSSQSFTVTNTGNANLVFPSSAVSITGTNADQFSKTADTCNNATVTPSSTCTVTARFAPTSSGSKSASLRFTNNASDSPQTVALTGTGIQADIDISPASKDYGDVLVGDSAYQSFTVVNTGTANLNVSGISIVGSSEFMIANETCMGSVTPSHACVIGVQFEPTATGAASATLEIASNLPNEQAALTGTGVEPAISVTPGSNDFGTVTTGSESLAMSFTVTNTGGADLDISSVELSGKEFLIAGDTCSAAPVSPAATCTVAVKFTPTVAGAVSGQITIDSDAPASPTTIALSGTGKTPDPLTPPLPVGPPPAVTKLSISAPKPRKPTKSLSFKFELSEQSMVNMTIQRKFGRVARNACERTQPATRLEKRCRLYRDVMAQTIQVPAGKQTIKISTQSLNPGAYRVSLTATNTAGTSPAAKAIFYRPWWSA